MTRARDENAQAHQPTAGPGAEPHVAGHAASSVAHRHSTDGGADQIHYPVIDREAPDGNRPVGKEMIILLDGRHDRVAEREGGLWQAEDEDAGDQVLPADLAQRDLWDAEAKRHYAQLC